MQFKIEPFKHPLKLDPNYAENTWNLLEGAIQEINNHNASGLSYEELYRNAYNMVVNKHGDKLYIGLIATETNHLRKVAARIEHATGESLLRLLKEEWDAHNKSVQMIRDILMYMDRIYVPTQRKAPIHQLGLDLWRDVVVRSARIKERMLSLFLEAVARERGGEPVDRYILKATSQMLRDLGSSVYVTELEVPLLERTTEFYAAEAQEKIASCSAPAYLEHVEKRLKEEVERVEAYLDASTEVRLTAAMDKELIAGETKTLIEMEGSGLSSMLDHNRYDDLRRMYVLFKRVDGGADLLRTAMKQHIQNAGKALVLDPERCNDPVEYIRALLAEKEKFNSIVWRSFSNDKTFVHALGSAFEHFINLNARSPEYLSLFIDDRLKKGTKGANEDEIEAILDSAITLFRFIQEKDVFEKYYKQHLAKRLLGGRSGSEDAERSMLVKLKTECGYQFTQKLESMFADIKTSQDTIMPEFKSWLTEKEIALPVDLTVQVLTTGSWPNPGGGGSGGGAGNSSGGGGGGTGGAACTLPREIESACGSFTDFYNSKFKAGRRLAWQTSMGTSELRATFGGKKHELSVSTHHMVVLLLFNDADTLTFSDIKAASGISEVELKRVMQSLACVKGKNVLKKDPMGKDVSPTDVFSINDSFSSKLYKVKIGMVAATRETDLEKADTRERVEEDRKPQIEAAIVRIMKARKVLSHNDVIAEVTKQLAGRFIAQPAVIKKRIESLIDREFLERDATERSLYRYLA